MKESKLTQEFSASRILCDFFIVSTWLTIFALAYQRIHWFIEVYLFTSTDDYGAGVHPSYADFEYPTPYGLWGGYSLQLYDQSIFFYSLVAVSFLLLLLFGGRDFGKRRKALFVSISALFYYSAVMVISQIIFLGIVAPGRQKEYLFSSCLLHNTEPVSCINDPHYATLMLSLLAILFLASPALLEWVKKWMLEKA